MGNERSFYHAFLSFKGETRNKFTCFLHDALKADGFEVFMDKEEIRVGDEVDSRIHDGIKGSTSAIVVFSENYAFSTWCLDELLLILERKKKSRYFIMPIFYEVEPADIKHQRGNFGAALEKHKKRHNADKVEKWRQLSSCRSCKYSWRTCPRDAKYFHKKYCQNVSREVVRRVPPILPPFDNKSSPTRQPLRLDFVH